MVDLHTKKDIDRISFEILRGSKSFDVFPTPVDKITAFSELVIRKDVDISSVHTAYLHRATDALRSAISKVRGMFDRKEKVIYLDLSQKVPRRNFVQLHEVGHGVLTWQTKIHDLMDDDNESLGSQVLEEFESEANYFASVTLFQHDRFFDEVKKYNLSIESSMQIAKLFGASIHASLRKYVESSPKRCALIVLENISIIGKVPKCTVRDKFHSKKFNDEFGAIAMPEELGYTWSFVQDYYHNRRFRKDGQIQLVTKNGLVNFEYHFFNSTYNAFVFLFPKGEKKSASTKIVLLNHT
jgi:Zn-dependent peptidase ImmA (M78 family)